MCSFFEQHLRKQGLNPFTALPEQDIRRELRPTDRAYTIDADGARDRYWSLIPPWADSRKPGYPSFNARAESVADKPSFRQAWRRGQRCLVPASAYFEWPRQHGKKVMHRIAGQNSPIIWLAGLWERWPGEQPALDSCTLITVAANEDMAWVHPRMPRILDEHELDTWLHGSPEDAAGLLEHPVATPLSAAPASPPEQAPTAPVQPDLFTP